VRPSKHWLENLAIKEMNSLTYLTLIVTYQCSNRCDHCCIGAAPKHSEWMSVEDANKYISAATKHGKITWMTLIGGEAILDLERTIEIGKIALSYGIPNVEIDTGAYWARNDDITAKIIKNIYDAGLRLGQISVDGFHQKYVKPVNVLRLFRVAREMGIELHASGAVIQTGDPQNPYDAETLRLKNWLADYGFDLELAPVVFQGRAINLSQYHSGKRQIPKDTCDGAYYFATSDWRQPGGVQIDVVGSVMLDHGILIGNAKQDDLSEILENYSAEEHPIISVLMHEGPIGLTRLPAAKGFTFNKSGYIDKCHLCQDIRSYLRPAYPAELAPDNYYPELEKMTMM
jgi:pyruvate-formate lyase-activating enzyme